MKTTEQYAAANNETFPEYHPFKSQEAKDKFLVSHEKTVKLWPIPSKTVMVDTSYGKTFVRISGPQEAPLLVLLHGMGGNSLAWLPDIEALSTHFRTYAVDDIYGYGLSRYTKSVNGPDDYVNWLDELFDALEPVKNINLMGLSYGAWQTALYALRFPERLNKIVLVAPVATLHPVSSGFMIRMLLSLIPHEYFFKSFMFWLWEDCVKKDKYAMEEMLDRFLLNAKCFKPRRLPNPTVLKDDELKSISVPALYIVGENEKICSAEKALQRIHKVAPQIKTELIPGAGHDLLFVQSELIHKKILHFLE